MPSADDIKFKDIALQNNLATINEIADCMSTLAKYEKAGMDKPLSAVMIEKEILDHKQANGIYQMMGKGDVHLIRGYTIFNTLGQGGLGIVYKARQDKTGRAIALKVMYPNLAENDEYVERFMREAKISMEMDHAYIVRGLDFGESNNMYYFAMEFIDGASLKEVLKDRGALSEQEAADIIYKMADALKYAEINNLVHRDIKPDNIMITHEGIPKLCDLGLAKNIESNVELTHQGIVVGTPHYMSPEQAVGETEIDIRSDIYSLGITFYHMVSGELPYQGTTAVSIINQHITADIPSPRQVRADLSDDACNIITKMMAKRPEERYQGCQELLVDLKLLLQGKGIDEVSPISPLQLPRTTKKFDEDSEAEAIANGQTLDMSASQIEKANKDADRPQVESVQPIPQHQTTSYSSEDLVKKLEREKLPTTKKRRVKQHSINPIVFLLLFGIIMGCSYLFRQHIVVWYENTLGLSKEEPLPPIDAPVVTTVPISEQASVKYLEWEQKIAKKAGNIEDLTRNMVQIQSGQFKIGSSSGDPDEQMRTVQLESFWMDKYEVSNEEFAKFCQATKYPAPKHWGGNQPPGKISNHPVVNVSWYGANLYAKWVGKSLPSEEQWEAAARGPKGNPYPWGKKFRAGDANISQEQCWDVSYCPKTTPTGLFNMAGNVWEWTSSNYGSDEEDKVIKGGSFGYPAFFARASYRDGFFQHSRRNDIGFRCVINTAKEQEQ